MQNLESFCNAIFGLSYSKVIAGIEKKPYVQFVIPKKSGTRTISYLPRETELSKIQYKLLNNFLSSHSLPVPVKGFVRGSSYRHYLMPHIGSNYFLRLDIKDFFGSITKMHIDSCFNNLITMTDENEKENVVQLIWDIVSYEQQIPQGACTSPVISNLTMMRLDQRILKYCQVFDIEYTRYADDLLFSSKKFDFTSKHWFRKKIKYILMSEKFYVNYSKIKMTKNEISLNGFVVSSTDVRLSRTRLSDIRHVISFVKTHINLLSTQGADWFLKQINAIKLKHRDLSLYPFTSLSQLIQYLCGYRAFLISWIDNVNPDNKHQKELIKLINRIEREIVSLSHF